MSANLNELSRRRFLANGSIGGLLVGSGLLATRHSPLAAEESGATSSRSAHKRWFETAWRRAVIDMHIPDWDEAFLSQFDADQFVERLIQSRAQSVVCYAHSHVGLFNYPTKVGQQHRGLQGRNIVSEMIERCHRKGIAVVLYSSLIHDRWAYDQHSDWHMQRHDGTHYVSGPRFGLACPNSPYREYVRAWVQEMADQFDVEGFRFDMTFLVGVCYCPHCRSRWADEVGGEMPTTVNWLDERWVKLQRKREEWLADFASICTSTVRRSRPQASVEHQSSTYPMNWTFGAAAPLVTHNDFLQGDFYGDALQGSFVRKLLEELTPNRPFAYETSFSVELRDHTASKPEPLLETKAAAAIADAAAFVFIDAIDPIGSVNPHPHERMGRVFDRLMPYYEHLGGERVADVAVYYSLESKFNHAGNGKHISDAVTSDSHTAAAMQATRWLLRSHLPLAVITKKSLAKLPQYKTLVLPCVNMMDEEEVAAIREFVRNGGTLYASGGSSLVNKRGQLQDDFMLADVFGVSIKRVDWLDREHYIAPTAAGQELFDDNYDAKYPVFVKGYGMTVEPHKNAKVLATTTLPWPTSSPEQFSSIHSNPPWQSTNQPEIVYNRFGTGQVVYCASLVENLPAMQNSFIRIIRRLNSDYRFEVTAPATVEATMFHQPDRQRYVLSLVNFPADLPSVPVSEIEVRLRLPKQRVECVELLPRGGKIPFDDRDGLFTFVAPKLEVLAMFAVKLA